MITSATRARIGAEMALYPEPRGALLAALRFVQEEKGFVSDDATRAIADIFGIPAVEVSEVLSFHPLLRSGSVPRHRVHVCTGLPCALQGSRTLLTELAAHLADAPAGAGERISLEGTGCLGVCAVAPVMWVDTAPRGPGAPTEPDAQAAGDPAPVGCRERVDADRAKQILDGLE